MCSIAGAFSYRGDSVSVVKSILSDLRHRGSDAFGIAVPKKVSHAKKPEKLEAHASQTALGHSLLSITGYCEQPIARKNVSIAHNGQIYNYEKFGSKKTESDSVVIADFLEKELKKSSPEVAVKKFMEKAEGEYCIGFLWKNRLFAFRDSIGLKPLWLGANESFCAFASEPWVLMKQGIQFPAPLLPGSMAELTSKGIKTKKILFPGEVKKIHAPSFAELKNSFDETISLQTRGLEKAAVLFSGGVDSSLIAKAVSEKVPETVLFAAGVKGSHDLVCAKKIARGMGLDFVPVEIKEKGVPALAMRSMKILSFFDEMQIGLAVPELACSDEIKKRGFRVVFSGQGSDEIFCGYSAYAKALAEKGYRGVEEECRDSIARMWSRNFYRDDAVFARNSLELRVPLVSRMFLKTAMSVPVQKKILSEGDKLRKHPVRELARAYGVPIEAVNAPKKALQYGSGSQKIVSRLMR